jgi:hypothetical protein
MKKSNATGHFQPVSGPAGLDDQGLAIGLSMPPIALFLPRDAFFARNILARSNPL